MMIKSLKEIRRELQNRQGGRERERDDGGRVIVDFCVHSDDDFLSPYSLRSNAELSTNASEFIEHSLETVPVKEQVRLRVHSNVITAEEEKVYKEAIKEYYEARFEAVNREKKRLFMIAMLMALVGVFALTAMIALEVLGRHMPVLSEVIDIFAWVFLWESVDLFFFEATALRMKSWRYLALSACVVEYLPLTKREETV